MPNAATACRLPPQRRSRRMTSKVATIPGGVTTPRGFRAAGVSAGIKANGNPDLTLLAVDAPAQAAAVFTTNKVVAAAVSVSKEHLRRSGAVVRAIVVNSGCANACTGDAGAADALEMTAATARLLGCPVEQVLVASTGVIGVNLPMDKVRAGLPVAFSALGADQGSAAARAIMTTDLSPKESAARIAVGGRDVTIGGMAKGAGMIEPNLATMLGFVTTDASVPGALLDRALREAVDCSFNAITVDGDSSTNDCVMLLASGASGVTIDESSYAAFLEGLTAVCRELALAIVRGGEGATKLVTVNVTGAATSAEARKAAKVIANSLLVKTAIHGGDPNWGRLICAAGRAGVALDPSRAEVTIGSLVLFKDGQPHDELAPAAADYLKGTNLTIGVDLGSGTASSTVWTCDLSAEYVRINADYRT
jgi:glutamate N-acetyltransferase / amino-acid N-acetyltransferase